jgi:glutamyl-tRNA synthetase
MIERFSLERVNKAPASFDPKKLFAFQDHYMQRLPLKQKVAKVLPYLQRAELVSSPPPCSISDKLTAIVTAAGDRIKVAGDILDYRTFFVADSGNTYDESAFDKRIRKQPQSAALLAKFGERLRTLSPFDAATLEKSLHDFVQDEGIEIGGLVHPLRVAVTGQPVGFGLFETMAILGRESCLSRIQQALARANSQ